MRAKWHQGVWVVAVVVAFGGGYLLKEPTRHGEPSVNPPALAPEPTPVVAGKPEKLPDLLIPTDPPTPLEDVEVNRHDPAFRAIQHQLGIKTGSILDDAKPNPFILTSQREEREIGPMPREVRGGR